MPTPLARLLERAPQLAPCAGAIAGAYEAMRACLEAGGKLLLCGNGGSGSDAEHWAGELLKGFLSRRPLRGQRREQLGEALAPHLQGGLPAIPLTGFLALRTAWLNDCEPDYLYAQLVSVLGRPGDLLVGISTSGNARNVCHALDAAARLGLDTVALTGRDGGRAATLARLAIRVPADEVHHIQELHLPVYHTLCLLLEEAFFPEKPDGEP